MQGHTSYAHMTEAVTPLTSSRSSQQRWKGGRWFQLVDHRGPNIDQQNCSVHRPRPKPRSIVTPACRAPAREPVPDGTLTWVSCTATPPSAVQDNRKRHSEVSRSSQVTAAMPCAPGALGAGASCFAVLSLNEVSLREVWQTQVCCGAEWRQGGLLPGQT